MLLANILTIINTKLLRSNIYTLFFMLKLNIFMLIIINLRLDREIEFHYMIIELFFK